MKRATLNFVIDTVAFVAFVLLTSTGVLMSYVLPPGSGRFSKLWGMDRHDWGQLHFWIAVVLLVFLVLHLLLHWRWVVCMVKGQQREGSGIRVALSFVGVITLVALAALPFLGRVEHSGNPSHRMRSTDNGKSEGYYIDGSTTLADVEQMTGIPAATILRELGLPGNLSTNEKLGRLRKEYRFELKDLREVVRKQVKRKQSGPIKT